MTEQTDGYSHSERSNYPVAQFAHRPPYETVTTPSPARLCNATVGGLFLPKTTEHFYYSLLIYFGPYFTISAHPAPDFIDIFSEMVGDPGIEPGMSHLGGVTVRCRTLQPVAQH